MAVQVTSQVLHDGARNLIMQLSGFCDGFGGEDKAVKVDMAELAPVPRRVTLWNVEFEIIGGLVELYWDANDPEMFLQLGSVGEYNYARHGGLPNRADTTTGNVLLSTPGFDAGSTYNLILDFKKKF